jgi:RNA polymerase sigma factor (sigma-70 family)
MCQAKPSDATLDAQTLQSELLLRVDALYEYVAARIPPRLRPEVAPEDVLQEVWIGAFTTISSYNPSKPYAFDRWLTGVVNHKLVDALKAATRLKRGGGARRVPAACGRRSSLYDLFARLASPRGTPSREYGTREAACALQIALSRLPVDRRTAVRMRYLEGRSRPEIAQRMQKSEAAVNSLLFCGLRDLRRFLGDAAQYFSDVRSSEGVGD